MKGKKMTEKEILRLRYNKDRLDNNWRLELSKKHLHDLGLIDSTDRERNSSGWTLGGLSHWDASDSDKEESKTL